MNEIEYLLDSVGAELLDLCIKQQSFDEDF
jgi:hypothetical protein